MICQSSKEQICKFENGFFWTCVVPKRGEAQPRKIESIKECQNLVLAKGVSSFLGLAIFYKKFIKKKFALAKSLTDLLKKKGSFKWKDEQQSAFNFLKRKFLSTLILQFLDFAKLFEMHMDVSGFVIGAVLMQ